MNYQNLITPKIKEIIPGLIVAIMLTVFQILSGFAPVAGIIFGVVLIFALDNNKMGS
jgi:hypothetical protein